MEDYETSSQPSDEEFSYESDGFDGIDGFASYSDGEDSSYIDKVYLPYNFDNRIEQNDDLDNQSTQVGYPLFDPISDFFESFESELLAIGHLTQAVDVVD